MESLSIFDSYEFIKKMCMEYIHQSEENIYVLEESPAMMIEAVDSTFQEAIKKLERP